MVRENMRSPRAVFQLSFKSLREPTSGWLLSGSTPGLAPTLRDVTVLFFRLLLKKTVLSRSEGLSNLLKTPPSRRELHASEIDTIRISRLGFDSRLRDEYGHTT